MAAESLSGRYEPSEKQKQEGARVVCEMSLILDNLAKKLLLLQVQLCSLGILPSTLEPPTQHVMEVRDSLEKQWEEVRAEPLPLRDKQRWET